MIANNHNEWDHLRPAKDRSLIALVDCDTFYASCERVARPDLLGKPVVVLSNNDGCIVAESREAKKLGIPMGKPEFQVRPLLQKYGVAVFSSNYTLYGDLSHRVMQTIASVVPEIEIYSIDEAFVPLNPVLAVNADEIVKNIRQRVLQWVGLPISAGIAPTRVLAKIATKVAKKYPVCKGIYNILHCRDIRKLLESIPVADLWGIGKASALKLKCAGIHTALDLRNCDPDFIQRLLDIHGRQIVMELRGIPAIGPDIPASHNCIISSRSLGYKVRDIRVLEEAAAFHAARAAEKLRQKNLLAQMTSVRIQTARYAEDQPQHDEMGMLRMKRPTLDSAVIITAAKTVLKNIYKPGYAYAKIMVMLTDLSDPSKGQHDLLEIIEPHGPADSRRKNLMELMDRVNRVQGRGTLVFAAQGAKDADWHMNQDRLSPAWTTDLNQLLIVRGEHSRKRNFRK